MAREVYTADERLYLDAEGKVVKAADPGATTLLVPAGGDLPIERAQELGLVKQAAKPADKARKAAEDK